MKSLKVIPLLLAFTVFHLQADANSSALKKLAKIADAPLIITTDTAAGSPSVNVTDKGVSINKSETPVPLGHTLASLAALPPGAWPCGRVVFFSISTTDPANGGTSQDDAEKLALQLQKANIRLIR